MVCCKHILCLCAVQKLLLLVFAAFAALFLFTACGDDSPIPGLGGRAPAQQEHREPRPVVSPLQVLVPRTGEVYLQENGVTIDTSNLSEGYVMVRYEGDAGRAVAQVEKVGVTYTYELNVNGEWEVLPLSEGNGSYTITVLEHVHDQMFAILLSTTVDVTLRHHTLPFLHPNQFVNFHSGSNAVALAASLAQGATSELEVVENIYRFIIENIEYDDDFAMSIVEGQVINYLPDIDATLASGRGICFDYAALMTAMIRAQMIPARLDIGYVSGGLFHAWISIYTEETGWIGMVAFNGSEWALLDPTFSAGGNSPELAAFIGDGTNYQVMFMH